MRRNRKQKAQKKGMTLMEMVVAIGIITIVMTGFSMLFISTWRSQANVIEAGTQGLIASRGVGGVMSQIRNARQADNGSFPIVLANEFEMTFFSDYDKDGVTERLHYYLQNCTLFLGVREPSGVPATYASGDGSTAIVAPNVNNTNADPVFQYFDETNAQVASPASVADVKMVKMSLIIEIDPTIAPDDLVVESFASIRNLSEHDTIN
ncbi:MAG: type II secretion system protein [Candidatus Moranbacteria bacterium]|nr:type II secretion system protein [Candidatus Moranbacteria bacterium]